MIFDSVSFDISTVTGTQVHGQSLLIYTSGRTFDVDYASVDAVYEAQFRLDAIIEQYRSGTSNSTNSTETSSDFLSSLKSKVQSFTDKIQGKDNLLYQMATDAILSTAKDKAQKMHSELEEVLGTVSAHVSTKLGTLVDDVMSVLQDEEPEVKPQATRNEPRSTASEKARKTRFEFNDSDAFGGLETENGSPSNSKASAKEVKSTLGSQDEPLIEDMSYTELEAVVNTFVDDAIENPKVQDIFNQLSGLMKPDDMANLPQTMKSMIINMALANPSMRLSDVINRFFH